jgi:hypothetical protein
MRGTDAWSYVTEEIDHLVRGISRIVGSTVDLVSVGLAVSLNTIPG